MGVPDEPDGCAEVHAGAGGWGAVPYGAGQCLGDRCAVGSLDLALSVSAEQGRPYRQSRGGGLWRLGLFYGTGLAPGSLDAKDGKVRWNVEVADHGKGYWTTMAPLIVGNHVIVGVGGDQDNIPMFLQAFDPETGKLQWRWDVSPKDCRGLYGWDDVDSGDV